MGMVAILFYDAEPFQQTDNMPSTEGPMWNLVQVCRAVSEKKTFKEFEILYMYIAMEQGQIILGNKSLVITERVRYFDQTLQVWAIGH